MTDTRGWHTLDRLGAKPGDTVRHMFGHEHVIKAVRSREFTTIGGFALRGDLEAWDIVERASDREAREHAEQREGTE